MLVCEALPIVNETNLIVRENLMLIFEAPLVVPEIPPMVKPSETSEPGNDGARW